MQICMIIGLYIINIYILGLYIINRLEALASRLIIGMASWLIVKLVVVGELVGL